MEHKWLRNFDSNGKWTKPERKIRVDGVEHDLDEYAAQHGIKLPDCKKQVNIDIVTDKDYADMGQSLDQASAEVDGTGNSEGSE